MIIRSVLAVLLAGNVGAALAASFDCSKAASYAEKEICRDGYLSEVDEILSRSYKKALAVASDPDALRKTQREWLALRDQCTVQICLQKTLGARIQVLDATTQAEQTKAYEAEARRDAEQQQVQNAEREDQRAQRQAVADRAARAKAAPHQEQAYNPAPATPPAPTATAARLAAPDAFVQWFFSGPGWKYLMLLGIGLSIWAVVRHHRGSATIYSDYTDASITNALPAIGAIIAVICHWLEMPGAVSWLSLVLGFSLSVSYSIYATVKSNRGGLSIFLSIVAKLTLITIFFAVIGLLITSLFAGSRRKGESRARADARNRREKKAAMAAIAVLSTLYTAFTVWVCRNPQFTPLGECLEFKRPPRLS